MRILVLSDSHGMVDLISDVIGLEMPDKIFFLGDCISDIYDAKNSLGIDICAVKGNVDYYENGVEDMVVKLMGKKILLTHGHKYGVKYNYFKLFLKAKEYAVDYVLFGHTHRYIDFNEEGIRFINPGSIGKPREDNNGSYVIIDLEVENIKIIKKELTL